MAQYIVKKGDNLSTIAKKNGIKLNEILKLNKLDNPDLIQIGQKINLPGKTEPTNTISLKNNTTKPYKEFLADQLKVDNTWKGAVTPNTGKTATVGNFNKQTSTPVKAQLKKPKNKEEDSSIFDDIKNTVSKYSQMASTTYNRKIKPLFEDKYDDENSTTKMNLQTPKKAITYDNITGNPIKDPEMGADIYHRSRYIDLDNPDIKTGIHNRGTKIKGDQPFKQILFSNFDNKKFESINPTNIKDDSFYIGQDDTGKIIMGNGKDLKSKKGSISEFSILKDIIGFSKVNNNIETAKSKDAKKANNPYLVNDKNEKVPLNILSSTDDNGNDKYGQWYGGSLIVTSPDMKKKVLISGSLNEVNQGLEKFKKDNNLSKVHVVKVDNGSYSRQFASQNPKGVNQEFWSKYEGLNTSGGNNLYEYEHGGKIIQPSQSESTQLIKNQKYIVDDANNYRLNLLEQTSEDFMKGWVTSPMYKKMFDKSKQKGEEPIPESWITNTKWGRKPILTKEGVAGNYNSSTDSLYIKNNILTSKNQAYATGVHEISHSSDNGGDIIPLNDVKKMKDYAKIDREKYYEELPWYKKILYDKTELNNSVKEDLDFKKYVAEPTETRARLNVIRALGKKQGVYDPYISPINSQQLNEIKFEDDGYNPIDQLKLIYSDEEIIDMLNSISKNNDKKIIQGKFGTTAETIYSMSEQPKVILTPDDIKAESGFNFQKYFPMERDIPVDTTTSYNRDIDRFAWKNTLQNLPEIQKQQQEPNQQIDSSYYTTKTPKGYFNVYDKQNQLVGYSMDNKTVIKQEPNFEDGGNINTLEGDLFSKVLMFRNQDKQFVDRQLHPEMYLDKVIQNPDGTHSTHKMSWGEDEKGQAYMFPTLFNDKNESIKVPNQYADYISSKGYKNSIFKENGGMIQAWIQKFAMGGSTNPYITPYTNFPQEENPIQGFNNQNNNQMQVPVAQSNMQPYSTPYQTNYNASNDQVNMDNKQADSMMTKSTKTPNPADAILGGVNMAGDIATGAIGAFAKPDSKASAYAQGSAKAQSIVKPLEKIPILGQASKLISGVIGGALNARKQGIEDEETAKKDKQLEYLTRNTMNVNQPSYYGQYMAKYGANPKMMEQRVIDDIYSDFDKYLKLT